MPSPSSYTSFLHQALKFYSYCQILKKRALFPTVLGSFLRFSLYPEFRASQPRNYYQLFVEPPRAIIKRTQRAFSYFLNAQWPTFLKRALWDWLLLRALRTHYLEKRCMNKFLGYILKWFPNRFSELNLLNC